MQTFPVIPEGNCVRYVIGSYCTCINITDISITACCYCSSDINGEKHIYKAPYLMSFHGTILEHMAYKYRCKAPAVQMNIKWCVYKGIHAPLGFNISNKVIHTCNIFICPNDNIFLHFTMYYIELFRCKYVCIMSSAAVMYFV